MRDPARHWIATVIARAKYARELAVEDCQRR